MPDSTLLLPNDRNAANDWQRVAIERQGDYFTNGYEDLQSPAACIKNAKTPTMIHVVDGLLGPSFGEEVRVAGCAQHS